MRGQTNIESEQIEKLQSELGGVQEVTTGIYTPNLIKPYDESYAQIRKVNRFCYVDITTENYTFSNTGWIKAGTISIKPISEAKILVYTADAKAVGYARVTTEGDLLIYSTVLVETTTIIVISGTYITAE